MAAIRNAGGQNGLHLWQNGAAALGLHGFGPGGEQSAGIGHGIGDGVIAAHGQIRDH